MTRWAGLLATMMMLLSSPQVPAAAPPPLTMKPEGFFDPQGKRVDLRGANIGNWLLIESWMLPPLVDQFPDQYSLFKSWEDRFGKAKAAELVETYRSNYITDADFDMLQSFGLNTIRIPFHYSVLESDDAPMTIRPGGWKWLDYVFEQAEKRGMYVILDLHGTPGGQSNDHVVGRRDQNELWSSKENRARTAWIWEMLAKRYQGRPELVAYDVINEPWGSTREELRTLVLELYEAIRKVDANTPIIFPGYYDGIDFYGSAAEHGWKNIFFTMHFYPGFFGNGLPTEDTHARFILNELPKWQERMKRLAAPLLIGEMQVGYKKAGGGQMMRRYMDLYNSYGWPATIWSYKLGNADGAIGPVTWYMVTNGEKLPEIDFRTASYDETHKWLAHLSKVKWIADPDLMHWMTTKEKLPALKEPGPLPPKRLVPPKTEQLKDWSAVEVGAARAGGQYHSGEVLVVYGGGADIFGTKDQFHYLAKKAPGDFKTSVRVDHVELLDPFTKAGLMVRSSLADDAAHTTIVVLPEGGIETTCRKASGEITKATAHVKSMKFPIWLSASRKDGCVTLAYSGDGKEWTSIPCEDCRLAGGEAFAGIAVTSHTNAQLAEAKFFSLRFEGDGSLPTKEDLAKATTPPPHADAIPAGWDASDVGAAAAGGQRVVSPTEITLYGSGDDIWGEFDQFRFLARKAKGPRTLTVQLASLTNVHSFTKAGLMVREDTDAGSAMVMINALPNGSVNLTTRMKDGAAAAEREIGKAKFPNAWLRLAVDGTKVSASFSVDGKSWGKPETVTIAGLPENAPLGLASMSHNNGKFAAAEFKHITFEASK